MARKLKKLAATALATIAMTAAIPVSSAFAIDEVGCNTSEYMRVSYHSTTGTSYTRCFANAGSRRIYDQFSRSVWVTEIWTGNNRVQWNGDGRWQPDNPIDRWTSFTWPNNPGGVRMDEIRIL